MLHTFAKVLLVSAMLLIGASISFAQDAQWKVGDKIEIKNLSGEWVPGAVIGTVDWNGILMYRVKLDDDNAPNVYFNHTPAADIRARGGQTPSPRAAAGRPADDPQIQNAGGVFKAGDVVDTYYDPNHGHNRGKILEVGDRKYKVHYAGCGSEFDHWVDAALVRPPATISVNAPEITFLFGRWRTTTTAVGGNYMVWAQTPGIEINADGTYIWHQPDRKPPVRGRWTTDAKVPKLNEGTPKFDGIIVKDEDGKEWKVFKWVVPGGDKQDHIEIDRMCSGLSEIGTRVL